MKPNEDKKKNKEKTSFFYVSYKLALTIPVDFSQMT